MKEKSYNSSEFPDAVRLTVAACERISFDHHAGMMVRGKFRSQHCANVIETLRPLALGSNC